MKETGFFGGTFDPVHLGHLNLAIEIFEKMNLEKIIFCPTTLSPFKKEKKPVASALDRFEMIKLAINKLDNFEVTDLEIEKKDISYTIDTLKELKANNLRLIITEDALDTFHLWKDYKTILRMAPLIVGARKRVISEYKNKNINLKTKNFIKTSIFEISSTEIRERLKKRKYVSHLLLKEVVDYIYDKKLYF